MRATGCRYFISYALRPTVGIDCSAGVGITYVRPFDLGRLGLKTAIKYASRAVFSGQILRSRVYVPAVGR